MVRPRRTSRRAGRRPGRRLEVVVSRMLTATLMTDDGLGDEMRTPGYKWV